MNYTAFAKQYKGRNLEDNGAVLSKDFRKFAKSFQSLMKDNAATHNWEVHSCNVGHYDISGYLHKDGHYIYFSYAPARRMPLNLESANVHHSIMMRMARNPQDYIGGHNHFCSVKDIPNVIKRLDRMQRFFI